MKGPVLAASGVLAARPPFTYGHKKSPAAVLQGLYLEVSLIRLSGLQQGQELPPPQVL